MAGFHDSTAGSIAYRRICPYQAVIRGDPPSRGCDPERSYRSIPKPTCGVSLFFQPESLFLIAPGGTNLYRTVVRFARISEVSEAGCHFRHSPVGVHRLHETRLARELPPHQCRLSCGFGPFPKSSHRGFHKPGLASEGLRAGTVIWQFFRSSTANGELRNRACRFHITQYRSGYGYTGTCRSPSNRATSLNLAPPSAVTRPTRHGTDHSSRCVSDCGTGVSFYPGLLANTRTTSAVS